MPELQNEQVRHERSDFNPRAAAGVGGLTIALIVVSLIGVGILIRYFDARENERTASSIPLAADERERNSDLIANDRLRERFHGQPPLEGLPDREAAESDRDRLRSYGWVDRDKGIVHVPLDRAVRAALENKDKYLRSRQAAKGENP
jgi:hypothetical protein